MAMAVGGGKGGTMMSLNVTPLIDVLLVLLIIFMVINHHTPTGLAAIAPQPNKNKNQVFKQTVVVTVNASKQVAINTVPVTVDELGARLVDIFKTRNSRIVFVQGDPSLPFADVAEIIDIAKGAEIDKVGLITHAMEQGQ